MSDDKPCVDCRTETLRRDMTYGYEEGRSGWCCEWCSALRTVSKQNRPVRRRDRCNPFDLLVPDDEGAAVWLIVLWTTFVLGGLIMSVYVTVQFDWWMAWFVWAGVVAGLPALLLAARVESAYRRAVREHAAALTERWDGWSGRTLR